jgi:hypothetical protein
VSPKRIPAAIPMAINSRKISVSTPKMSNNERYVNVR